MLIGLLQKNISFERTGLLSWRYSAATRIHGAYDLFLLGAFDSISNNVFIANKEKLYSQYISDLFTSEKPTRVSQVTKEKQSDLVSIFSNSNLHIFDSAKYLGKF